jgi:spectinomycin phosphotransferase
MTGGPPDDLEEGELIAALTAGWELEVRGSRYVPVGFGSYHWDVTGAAGRRYFATVDDLDAKGWLGHDRDSAFDGLRAAFDVALALRRDAGLEFVVAPVPAARGETVRRVGSRYGVGLFPFMEGSAPMNRSAPVGAERTPADRDDVIRLLADLHGATPVALPIARRRHLDLPQRHRLEAALRELDGTWTGGPFSEPARDLLARHARELRHWLDEYDHLAAQVDGAQPEFVITHGEPHSVNVLRAGDRLLLVDWDTAGLAPPERDLCHVSADAGELALYTDLTGRPVDQAGIALYRLRWDLDDISIFTSQFRSAHARTPDAEKAWRGLRHYLGSEDGGGKTPVRSQPA